MCNLTRNMYFYTILCHFVTRQFLSQIYALLNENFHASKCVSAGGQVDWDKIPSLHEKNSDGFPNLLDM